MPRRAWLLALGAIAVRLAASLNVAVMDGDGARNLRMAQLFEDGRFAEALRVQAPTPPLHPFLTALGSLATGHRLGSGIAVSILLGGLAVLPLYAMARRPWGDRVATVAALLYAWLPAVVDPQIEPMTEGTFMFFFFAAMALGWRSLEEQSWEEVVVAAGCSAMAWLSRTEGIYLIPLFSAAAILHPRRFTAVALAVFLSTWTVLAFPYLSFIHAQTGRWETSLSPIPGALWETLRDGRRPPMAAQDYEEFRVVARYGRFCGAVLHLGANFFGKVLFYALGPFLVLGFVRPRPASGTARLLGWQGLAAAGYLVPVAMSFAASTPFSHRFLLVPATLLLPWAAAGICRAADRFPGRAVLPALVGALCLVMAVRDFRPKRRDKEGFKEAGLAILSALGPGAKVWATNGQIEYYARSRYVPFPEGGSAGLLLASGYDAFAVCPEELPHWEPGLEDRLRASCRFLGEYPAAPRPGALPVRVYRARSPEPGEGRP